ncbi:hypothetical protein L2E82_20684 [Cichorium intybus]|uniref:Uncharacterized protein n=1 Tax=Cichorium intybus TaxID=13427 RepID=A0ACB9DU08_CICIN|nr:hypothetical protein L2E82_20684 [Cichorium intybus]
MNHCHCLSCYSLLLEHEQFPSQGRKLRTTDESPPPVSLPHKVGNYAQAFPSVYEHEQFNVCSVALSIATTQSPRLINPNHLIVSSSSLYNRNENDLVKFNVWYSGNGVVDRWQGML